MKSYRFYIGTEAPASELVGILNSHDAPGASIFHGTGIWRGELEPLTVVEIVAGLGSFDPDLMAQDFAQAFGQDEVLYTIQHISRAALVGQDGEEREVGG